MSIWRKISIFAQKEQTIAMKKFVSFFCLIVLLIVFGCNRSDKQWHTESGGVWNTLYNVAYLGSENLADSIMEVFNKVGLSLSAFDSKSMLSRINAGEDIVVDSAFKKVYLASLMVNEKSGGMFDPTVAPLIRAWGFGKGHAVTADTSALAVDSILQFVGIKKTRLMPDDHLKKDDPRITFNFSAIAKGYGVDAIAEMLERNGVENYLVEVGGEIRTKGKSRRGDSWIVGVDSPEEGNIPGQQLSATVILENMAMATSGNYRNFHQSGNNKFGHTINPLTGRPQTTKIVSATVVAKECMMADAYATAIMAMTPEEAQKMINEEKLCAMIILADGSVTSTDSFKKIIKH